MRIIGGIWRGRLLERPSSEATRPTKDRVRQGVFNVLEGAFSLSWPDTWVLDAFAGSGGYGLEALSRGAQGAVFMERHRLVLKALKTNIARLSPDPARFKILEGETLLSLSHTPATPCGVIFLDPPYAYEEWETLLTLLQDKGWYSPESIIVLEQSRKQVSRPCSLRPLKEKVYGSTKVLFGRA